MFWGSRKSDDDGIPHVRDEPRPDFSKQPIPREKLPPKLQQLVDRDDSFFDEIYSPYSVDTNDTPYRYAAYANRVRTILLSAHRYVAYTSDIGESFRPVAHPFLVRGAYAISWTYILGDVAHEGYKAYLRNRRVLAPPSEAYKDATDLNLPHVMRGMATGNISGSLTSKPSPDGPNEADADLVPWPTAHIPLIEDYRVIMAKRAVFQSIASMGLPAFTIHSVVKYSGKYLRNTKNTLIRTWGPIGLGLAVVPFLPYLFDKPIEEAVEWGFETAIRSFAGESEVVPLQSPAHSQSRDVATLGSVMKLQGEKSLRGAGPESPQNSDAAVSWEEYKENKHREREQRKRQRDEQGSREGTLLSKIPFVSGKSKEE
ncbi:conserved hypothetical protein [Paecilomyces variotii No. 5]|uniref:Mitochondrial fission process protein 1 n=1 Tax=Byssochlamys spectabilis (strain No. 5 / NBRC 109023) TaxID=1356009 RepID=V5FC27_BYSSN|nr:conserved hypothetical protein [Paecilomyces variotii No. 5]